MTDWVKAFACTLAIETPVYVFGLSRVTATARATPRFVVIGVLVNLMTHPFAWALTRAWSWPRFAVVEAGVWVAESLLVVALVRGAAARAHRTARPASTLGLVAVAFTANALSAGVGLLLFS
jgi:hypothetical protein